MVWDYLEYIRNKEIVTADDDDSRGKSNEQRTPGLFETECSVQHSKQADWCRKSGSPSVKSSSSNSVSSLRQSSRSGRSTPDTEPVIDIQEDFKFHMSGDMQKCSKDNKYPDENILRRFIRDAAACLQGLVGSESISHSDFIIAATKICDTLPILQDPRPASFPPAKKFPYWGTILFMLKKRIQNQHGYQKRKIKGKRQATNEDKNISEAELEELSALLLKEVKAKKPNKEAIREIQVATFPSRSSHIDQLDKTVLSEISSSYPFFAIHECTLVNELELRCKKIGAESTSLSDFLKNWEEISPKIFNSFDNKELLPDANLSSDEVCGVFLEKVHQFMNNAPAISLLNIFRQGKSNVEEVIKKSSQTKQPVLWITQDDGMLEQAFIVIDNKIFSELHQKSYFHSLCCLIAVYYAFNLSYDKKQEILFCFLEEFILGVRHAKKSIRYRTFCSLLLGH
ncbi:uncharacterized protein LOC141877673 [Acropora palmata]|uniref:uncharacterized protein LOC141877673 n=1 Tax=Acropora palmata TaxID=6131 RepID=UPI003DA17715